MKKIGLGKVIDRGLVAVIVLVIAAAISFTGGTVLAIAHIRPFHQCSICDSCVTGQCENMITAELQH